MTTITTVSGREINLRYINPELINVDDIAHSLSRMRRFNGATAVGYSVASHALHVSDLVRRMGGTLSAQLAALHHDSHEYLIGDMVSPMKALIDLMCVNAYLIIEGRIQRNVLDALGIRTAFVSNTKLIHRADMVALATERRDLMPTSLDAEWPCLIGVTPDAVDIRHRAAKDDDAWADAFISRDHELRTRMAELMEYPMRAEATQ